MYVELSKWWRPARRVVRNVACCAGAGYGMLLRSVESERMACEMSTLERCLVRVMCALVQWLWRCPLSPCMSGCRAVFWVCVEQNEHVFIVLVMVVGLMCSWGWWVCATRVRAVCNLYRC